MFCCQESRFSFFLWHDCRWNFGVDWFGFGFLEELPYSLYGLLPATFSIGLSPVTIGKKQSLVSCAFHDAATSSNRPASAVRALWLKAWLFKRGAEVKNPSKLNSLPFLVPDCVKILMKSYQTSDENPPVSGSNGTQDSVTYLSIWIPASINSGKLS